MATRKQKAVVEQILANPSISYRKAMLNAGYAAATVVDPQNVLASKGFAELAAEMLPEDRLLDVARDGLDAMKITRDKFGDKYEDPDHYARHQFLETALRIRNLAQRAETPLGDVHIQVINYAEVEPKAESRAVEVTAKAVEVDPPSERAERS